MNKKRQYEKAFQILGGTNNVKTLCELGNMFWKVRAKEILSGRQFGFMGTVECLRKAICAFVSAFGAVAFDVGNPEYPDKFVVQKHTTDTDDCIRFRVDCISGTILEEDFD